jgi:tyrosyl-tRNA synthetase
MKISEELKWRGFVNQTTLADLSVLDDKKVTFYHGFDASADSLTIGNLASLMLDKLFIKHGHKAVLLAGGATSLIGDPGGKDIERPMQGQEIIESNVAAIKSQIQKLFKNDITVVNNLDWFKDMKVLDFLRDTGKHFSMTPLVQRDYIAKRIGEGGGGISYSEFSYTLLQGYDFWHLYKAMGVELQLSGSDQWGNSLSGVELIRRTEGKEVNVLTMPLVINQSTGKKFGKSEEGAVWMDPKRTDPVREFYQFWVNLDDEGVESYLKIFTELDKEDITSVMAGHNADKSKRTAQKRLAWEVTNLVHGKEIADHALSVAEGLSKPDLEVDVSDKITAKNGEPIVDVLVRAGLSSSKTEARQLVTDAGIYINDVPVSKDKLEETDFDNGPIRLRRGKKLNNSVIVFLEDKTK